jgi:hypothetical protein
MAGTASSVSLWNFLLLWWWGKGERRGSREKETAVPDFLKGELKEGCKGRENKGGSKVTFLNVPFCSYFFRNQDGGRNHLNFVACGYDDNMMKCFI